MGNITRDRYTELSCLESPIAVNVKTAQLLDQAALTCPQRLRLLRTVDSNIMYLPGNRSSWSMVGDRDTSCCLHVGQQFGRPKGLLLVEHRIYFTQECRDKTRSALEFLDVDAKNVERLTPGLIATAITYIVLILIIYFMSLWRSFIEAAHDATGEPRGWRRE